MAVAQVIGEVAELTPASIRFAEGIDHATSGDRLGGIMRRTIEENPGPFNATRSAVQDRIDALGGAGEAAGLFMLAVDMATTAAVAGDGIDDSDRQALRRLWDDLRAQD